jgi:hypothetical protein
MTKFKAGDMVKYTSNSRKALTNGLIYTVIDGGNAWVDVSGDGGCFMTMCPSQFELVVANKLQVGETYTSNNGNSWVAIYECNDLVWMKSPDGGAAYVFKRDGTTISMGSNNGYSINWEVTKGPIIEEGVYVTGGFHLGITGKGSYDNILVHNLTVTTVDGVPDWTTLACKENN